MAKRYEWPDPRDRSPNHPHILLEREAVLDLYKQATGEEDAKNLTEAIRRWFDGEAQQRGWDHVIWANQCAVLEKRWG
jgi:hypothetical protein